MPTLDCVMASLPFGMRLEIDNIMKKRRNSLLSEIRLRCYGLSSVSLGGERILLFSSINKEELSLLFDVLTDGALYAHRETLKSGYITIEGGVRVGVAGSVSYDERGPFCVTDVSSLVFRVPSYRCEVGDKLFQAFVRSKGGMLIYSAPGIGKTSALRELVRLLGGGVGKQNVVVIDERREFSLDDYKGRSVDVLSGYKKADGMEIALRTLSPDVMVIDEIGSLGEAEVMAQFVNCGVRVIATAHADNLDAVMKKKALEPFLSMGIFEIYAGLSVDFDGRRVDISNGDTSVT